MTKCNNCRFKAKIDGIVTTGIVSAKDGLNAFLKNEQGYNVGCLTGAGLVDSDNRPITDFEIVPRDPEKYTDWQVGDVICGCNGKNEIIFRSGEVVCFKHSNGRASEIYTCRELFERGYRLVLTDIEQQIIEERKKQEWTPQDGDICYAETKSGTQKFIIIHNHIDWSLAYGVCSDKWRLEEDILWAYSTIRPATEDEKQQLFDALAKEGKRWNAEKKVVEDIPKPYEFRKGEPVLVRNDSIPWACRVYVETENGFYATTSMGTDRAFYRHCIPYNEKTEHLLGTNDDYEEEQS